MTVSTTCKSVKVRMRSKVPLWTVSRYAENHVYSVTVLFPILNWRIGGLTCVVRRNCETTRS